MNYVSTRNGTKSFQFEDVFIKGLTDDGGLYVPVSLKKYNTEELPELKNLNFLAEEILNTPVRIGKPNNISGAIEQASSPSYAGAIGLAQWKIFKKEISKKSLRHKREKQPITH